MDPNDLARQRWALIVPAGAAGDAAIEALTPLCERRSAEQGAPARVLRLPAGLAEADLLRWREAVVDDEALRAQALREGANRRRLAGLPRRTHHKLVMLRHQLQQVGQPPLNGQHVVQARSTGAGGVEAAGHAAF